MHVKISISNKSRLGKETSFSLLVQFHLSPFRLLMQFLLLPQTKKISSESCVSREERQMQLCKVGSVVSSGEMNEFPLALRGLRAFRQTSWHLHTITATPGHWTQESSSVCEDVLLIFWEATEVWPVKRVLWYCMEISEEPNVKLHWNLNLLWYS